jgi:putative peptidoglycan lipid II flippase
MALYRAFATVGAMTIWSRVLGFIRDVLIAAVLGAGPVADAFFVAFRVPNLFRRLFAEGAFDAAFIPLFAKRFHGDGGEAAARSFAERALAGLTLALVVFTLVGELIMPWLMLLLAPGFAADPPKLELAILLARIALPFLLCMSLVALYSGVLNALGRFAVAAFAPSLLNVVLIIVLVALIGIGDVEQSRAAVALAWGIALSGVLQVIVVAVAAEVQDAPFHPAAAVRCGHAQAACACRSGLHRRRHEPAHCRAQHHHRLVSGPGGVVALLRRPAVPVAAWRHRRCCWRRAAA